jgi:uncharacterized membrane protein YccC
VATGAVVRSKRRGALVDAGWGGVEALGVVGSVLTFTSISLFNPFSLLIGVFIGGRSLRQLRQRELERRQEEATQAITRYLDEAGRDTKRQWHSALRRIRRELRTYFQAQADALHRSARDSHTAARRIADTDAGPSQRAEIRRAVGDRLLELETLDQKADALKAALSDGPR